MTIANRLNEVGRQVSERAKQLADQDVGRSFVGVNEWLARYPTSRQQLVEVYGQKDGSYSTVRAQVDTLVSALFQALVSIRRQDYERSLAEALIAQATTTVCSDKAGAQ
jgi:hypothetical protein